MGGIVVRILCRALTVTIFTVAGLALSSLALLRTLPKILMSPRRAFSKKKRSLPPAAYLDTAWGQHHSVQCNGIQLYYVAAGEAGKPLMLFLHGFPESWYSWRHQLRYFRHTHRVVAPDLRGYGRSSRPSMSVSDYHRDVLVEDIRGLIQELGYKKCVLVAHDWGGQLAWVLAKRYPAMVERLVVMDSPDPKVFMSFMKENRSQVWRSKYIPLFYIWWIPEFLMGLFDYGMIRGVFCGKESGLVNKERFNDDDLEVFKWTISRRGAATAALNYYRNFPSLIAPIFPVKGDARCYTMPTLVMWGENDSALDARMADEHERIGRFDDITVRVVPSCSHWLQQDQPDVVNQVLRTWLQAKQDDSPAVEAADQAD